jgi:hypothetical protein
MSARDRELPEQRHVESQPGEAEVGPFQIPYFSDTGYKPFAPVINYDHDTTMEAYARLGARLARTHRDYLPSEWIHAQVNAPDFEQYEE